ncbi:MAG: glycosyltransferase family 2 protein [Bacteroidetes bacterium]|nr:glycosyltransferase family 2 protein [Bacteroidota bacterium]
MMHSKLSIVIPAYNESASIIQVLEEMILFVAEFNIHVLVVNDGSKDDTLQRLQQFKINNPNFSLQIISHSQNRGYGGALKSGILHAKTEYVVTMDADGQHRMEDLPKLYQRMKLEGADLCIGNRNFKGSSFSRNVIKKMVLYFVRKATGIEVSDLNSGMKMYKTAIVKSLLKYTPNGMPFSDTIVLLHHQFRYKIVEEDIDIRARENGVSTINYKTAIYTIVEVANIIINFFPFKFFFYISVLLFVLSIIWGLPLVLIGKGLSTGTSFLLLASLNFFFFGIILENVVRSRFEHYTYVKEP